MDATAAPGLVNGVYSYAEAARLLNVTPQRVSRWADGYSFQRAHDRGMSGPVLQTERHIGVLSFDELWELMFVRAYVALEVPLPKIRETAEALARQVGERPFSTAKLLVHERRLLWETAGLVLMRPDVGQLVADYAADLAKHVQIRKEHVGRYDIPEFGRLIYLDRDRRGGEPVVSDRAIPTRIIFGLWEREKDVRAVAGYYELPEGQVSAAIRYEGQWRLAA